MQRITGLLVVGLLLGSATALADKYDDTKELFKNAGASNAFFGNSYAYAIFPTIGKGGFGIGGARGKGRVFVHGNHVANTTMTQITWGFQIGAHWFSQVIFFEDERSYREFTTGNFEFGANTSAVAVTAGASASTSTSGPTASASGGKKDATTAGTSYYKGMKVFTITKGGLMYEASIGGQKFSFKPAP